MTSKIKDRDGKGGMICKWFTVPRANFCRMSITALFYLLPPPITYLQYSQRVLLSYAVVNIHPPTLKLTARSIKNV